MRFFLQRERGMTLVQTIIIIGIIAVLSSVVLANISDARKKARDKERVSDLQQIQLALRMYKDLRNTYPTYDDGVVIGKGGGIDDLLRPYLPVILKDKMQEVVIDDKKIFELAYAMNLVPPSEPSPNDVTYGYVYDSNFDCPVAGNGKKVLYAKSMELLASSNWTTVCGGPFPDAGNANPGTNSYIIILK